MLTVSTDINFGPVLSSNYGSNESMPLTYVNRIAVLVIVDRTYDIRYTSKITLAVNKCIPVF